MTLTSLEQSIDLQPRSYLIGDPVEALWLVTCRPEGFGGAGGSGGTQSCNLRA